MNDKMVCVLCSLPVSVGLVTLRLSLVSFSWVACLGNNRILWGVPTTSLNYKVFF